MKRPAPDPREIAAGWLMREGEGALAPETAAERDAWLAEHPDHVAAYDATSRAMRRLEAVSADPGILALRASALSAKPARSRAWRVAAAVAAAAVLASGAGFLTIGRSGSLPAAALEQIVHPGAPVYRTVVGERSTVTLPDGSVAVLNTDTVLRVAYGKGERGVRLVRGQALFEVAHGQSRPFQVYAGDRVITALGTVFDVRLQGDAVKVALVEGRVRVKTHVEPSATRPAAQVTLAPGEKLEARPAEPMRVLNVDVARETSWRSGVLVFDETPLADAVAELNRYSSERLVIEDPEIAAFHVSGVFKTGDPERFARTVEEILPVRTEHRGRETIVLSQRGGSILPVG